MMKAMMKTIVMFTLTLILSVVGFCQKIPKEDCRKFHTGLFVIESINNLRIEVNRFENYQMENYGNNKEVKEDIKWIDECSFELVVSKGEKFETNFDKVVVSFEKVAGDTCYYKVTSFIDHIEYCERNRMIKIK